MNFSIFRDLGFWGPADSTKEELLQSQNHNIYRRCFESGRASAHETSVLWQRGNFRQTPSNYIYENDFSLRLQGDSINADLEARERAGGGRDDDDFK